MSSRLRLFAAALGAQERRLHRARRQSARQHLQRAKNQRGLWEGARSRLRSVASQVAGSLEHVDAIVGPGKLDARETIVRGSWPPSRARSFCEGGPPVKRWFVGFLIALAALAIFTLAPMPGAAQTAATTYTPPRTPDGQPDLQGVWQVLNTAAWDIQDHGARLGVPAGQRRGRGE